MYSTYIILVKPLIKSEDKLVVNTDNNSTGSPAGLYRVSLISFGSFTYIKIGIYNRKDAEVYNKYLQFKKENFIELVESGAILPIHGESEDLLRLLAVIQ